MSTHQPGSGSGSGSAHHRGRPKKPVHSRFIQIAAAPPTTPADTKQYAATIRLTPDLFNALITGKASAAIEFGQKDNEAKLLVNDLEYPLRCAKEESHKVACFQSTVYEDEEHGDEVPLFDPFVDVWNPLPDLQLQHRYYAHRELDEEEKKRVQKRSAQVEKELKQPKVKAVKHLSAAEQQALADGNTEAKRGRKRKSAGEPEQGDDADAAIPKKKKGTGKTTHATGVSDANSLLVTPATAASASASVSPSAALAAAVAALPGAGPLAKPKLNRSPSSVQIAALPSALTSSERLRARVAHLLAAQQHGLPMSTLEKRLGVPMLDLKGTLQTIATYEAPGFYRLKDELYHELALLTWPDYTDDDRRRIVQKMMRVGTLVPDEWAKFGPTAESHTAAATSASTVSAAPAPNAEANAASSTTPSAAATAAALPIVPLSIPAFPSLPDLSLLPDEVPRELLMPDQSEDLPLASLADPKMVLAAPRIIGDYLDFLQSHTQFLELHRAYRQSSRWLEFIAELFTSLQSQVDASPDARTKSARKKQVLALYHEHVNTLTACRRKYKVLHLLLTQLRKSLQEYAQRHNIYGGREQEELPSADPPPLPHMDLQ